MCKINEVEKWEEYGKIKEKTRIDSRMEVDPTQSLVARS